MKQGDGLSPLLFNIFINDLPQIFSGENNSPLLQNTAISCLTYADDLLLMSTSESGLQNCSNKLSGYCRMWKLNVNTQKTKLMILVKERKC